MKFNDTIELLMKSNKSVFSVYDAAKFMEKPLSYASLMLNKSKK